MEAHSGHKPDKTRFVSISLYSPETEGNFAPIFIPVRSSGNMPLPELTNACVLSIPRKARQSLVLVQQGEQKKKQLRCVAAFFILHIDKQLLVTIA